MEQKNLKREVVKQRHIRNVGCNLMLFPTSMSILAVCIYIGWFCYKRYFLGDTFIEPYQDKRDLAGLVVMGLMIFVLLQAGWRNALLFRHTVNRYITMKQEVSWIESLIAQPKVEKITETDHLENHAEAEKHKQSR
jgi:hypothetical protein